MAIHLPFAKLSQWQQVAFCAALLERMLPNYQMFAEHAGFGDFSLLRNQLDLVWQWLDKNSRIKINYDVQITKLEEQIPDPEAFDFLGVFPAVDTCMSLVTLFQSMQDPQHSELINVGKLSENSVSYYVELSLAQALEAEHASDDELIISPEQINAHPLMQWEKAMQNELFDLLKNASENKETCLSAKEMVLEQGLSNLGIEINR